MNRDDIIRMAREAGVSESELFPGEQAIERFAALVAAQEREACARVCEGDGVRQVTGDECAVAIRERCEK